VRNDLAKPRGAAAILGLGHIVVAATWAPLEVHLTVAVAAADPYTSSSPP